MVNRANTSFRYQRAFGTFSSRRETEAALRALQEAGFDMNHVSIIGRDHDGKTTLNNATVKEEKIGNKADEGATAGAVTGGALGTLVGLLVGLGTLAIPGIGPILLAGAEATAIATTLAGTAIGAAAGSLLGALIGLGIPEERAKVYSDRISQGHDLVMITGTSDVIQRAETLLRSRGIHDWEVYDVPNPNSQNIHPSEVYNAPNPNPQTVSVSDVEHRPLTSPDVVATKRDNTNVSPAANRKVASTEPEVVIVDKRDVR